MLFSSLTFLYCFLPCVLLVYFVVPDRMNNAVLLLASLFFYGWGEPKYLIFMLASVTQSYAAALLVERFRGIKIAKAGLPFRQPQASVCLLTANMRTYLSGISMR